MKELLGLVGLGPEEEASAKPAEPVSKVSTEQPATAVRTPVAEQPKQPAAPVQPVVPKAPAAPKVEPAVEKPAGDEFDLDSILAEFKDL